MLRLDAVVRSRMLFSEEMGKKEKDGGEPADSYCGTQTH
jgi:hypothetical protein